MMNEIGPGKYEHREDIEKKETEKKQIFRNNLEVVQFHKLRHLFP